MATVKELIKYLEEIPNKEQPIIYQYYIAEHFDTTAEVLETAIEDLDCDELWIDAYRTLEEYIESVEREGEEEDDEELD